MKYISNIKVVILAIALVVGIYSCTSDGDDYLKYTKNGEISYVGIVDSLEVLSGKKRVEVQGLIIGDPKVTEVRVYWNSSKDSIVEPITRTGGIDVVSIIIDELEENVYNFVVKTFDNEGNTSIPVSRSSEAFGDRYQASLFNRQIVSNELVDTNLTINFEEVSLTSGILGCEIEYTTTSGSLNTIFVDLLDVPDSEGNVEQKLSVDISDFESGSTYRYRTVFVPEVDAIDRFYTDFEIVEVI